MVHKIRGKKKRLNEGEAKVIAYRVVKTLVKIYPDVGYAVLNSLKKRKRK